jgi:hypothetical protein
MDRRDACPTSVFEDRRDACPTLSGGWAELPGVGVNCLRLI